MTRVIGTADRVFYGARIEIGPDGQIAQKQDDVGQEVHSRIQERMSRDGLSYSAAMRLVLDQDADLKQRYSAWTPHGGQ